MKACFLFIFSLLLLVSSLSAQQVKKMYVVKRNKNGFHGTDYISVGRGKYSNKSLAHPAVNIALMAEYRYNHFYANAGLAGYLFTADALDGYLGSYTRQSKFLVALPAGMGFINSSNRTTIQFGLDVPYLAEINLNATEKGFALSPRFCLTLGAWIEDLCSHVY